MYCPKCGHENVPDARFCAICGSPLATQAGPPDARPSPPSEQRVGLIPHRDLGELIGETFSVYREHFWPFVLIALVPQVPSIVSAVIPGLGSTFFDVIFVLLGFLLSILAGGAAAWAVAQQYVAPKVDVGECFTRAWNRVLSLIIAFVLVGLALLGSAILSLVIIGIPLFFYLVVIWFFTTEAIMIEGRGPIAALGRSRELVRGSWWRVFGIDVVYVLILLGIFIAAGVAVGIAFVFGSVAGNLVFAVVSVLVTPIFFIGKTLLYFDLRVRKEGYTLDVMASEIGP